MVGIELGTSQLKVGVKSVLFSGCVHLSLLRGLEGCLFVSHVSAYDK